MSSNSPDKTQSRKLALQTLYQEALANNENCQAPLEISHDDSSFLCQETVGFAQKLVSGVLQHKTELDQRIQSVSTKWKVERMPLIDVNIMRITIYEMTHLQLKPSIAINEAVELGKVYGSTESSSFINGILDTISKKEKSS